MFAFEQEDQWNVYFNRAEIILKAAEGRKGQKPLFKPSRASLIYSHNSFSSQAQAQAAGATLNISSNIAYNEHPPCIALFDALEKKYLEDLRLELAHRGRYVILRAVVNPDRLVSISTIAEDENGEVETVQIYNQDDRKLPVSIVPEGQVFIVKEPFFKMTFGGGTSIRVDHVSDIIFLDGEDERVPEKWRPRLRPLARRPLDWKEDGNRFYGGKQYFEAAQCYTKGLELAEPYSEIERILLLNRAQVYLELGYTEKALADADKRSLLLRGCDYESAKARLVKLLKECPENKNAKDRLLRTFRRLREQRSGEYEFAKMRNEVKEWGNKKGKLDCAEYVGPVRVGHAGSKGRGLFTTRDVKFGELLLCSKAFKVCHKEAKGARFTILFNLKTKNGQSGTHSQLVQELIQILYHNPKKAKRFYELTSGDYERVKGDMVDGLPIVDSHLVMRITLKNCFGCPRLSALDDPFENLFKDPTEEDKIIAEASPTGRAEGSGIWILPSYMNHSCWPNSVRSFLGDLLIVRAARDIPEGEEITTNYLQNESRVQKRQKLFRSQWAFECQCTLCEIETAESDEVKDKREELVEKALKFKVYLKRSLTKIGEGIKPMIKLVKGIEATYSTPEFLYPRVPLISPTHVLHTFLVRKQRPSDVLALAKGALNGLGFKIQLKAGKLVIERYGYLHFPIINLFVHVITAAAISGQSSTAMLWRNLTIKVYEVVAGERESFFDVYERPLLQAGVPVN
ncbi:SET domain-containing protein [Choiromyces venosus 120613-1]|uniref:SET domain-containing protein n=1 Tax=Choiromyces venosus 120613-1 TaxID=1336337 RepID=A0A3N4J8L8_9PEZI|nr:SET domain-containing protein [Choiromyces venosus 120613-1]